MPEPVGPCFCLLSRFCLRLIDPHHFAWAAQCLRESQVGLLGWRAHSLKWHRALGVVRRHQARPKVRALLYRSECSAVCSDRAILRLGRLTQETVYVQGGCGAALFRADR